MMSRPQLDENACTDPFEFGQQFIVDIYIQWVGLSTMIDLENHSKNTYTRCVIKYKRENTSVLNYGKPVVIDTCRILKHKIRTSVFGGFGSPGLIDTWPILKNKVRTSVFGGLETIRRTEN